MDLSARRPGPDVARALAMAGVVVMNYHGYLILDGAPRDGGALYDVFDPWTGPLSTRFAALFVLTAGVGVTLMTQSSMADPVRRREVQWRLVRRGVLLYTFGLLFDFIWPGTILPYYGAMFVLAAALVTLRDRWLVVVGALAALAGWLANWWVYERRLDDQPVDWLTDPGNRSPVGLLIDVLFNGTHPVLPWLAFLCAGIVLGRLLSSNGASWQPAAVATGLGLYVVATIAAASPTTDRALELLSDDPFDRSVVYTASALGTSLLAFTAIAATANRFEHTAIVDWLRRAGQLSLTIYIGHALVFNLVVDWLDLLQPDGIGVALGSAVAYWLVATGLAVAYQRAYGRGPAERLYRRLTA
ncbi:MAG: DUF418 domain-containing protein [Ilumatobacter sp.]|nr:DUF418 domain-containing protein [Ilumatobacter sp.]